MNRTDEVYYEIKQLKQDLDFYTHKADHKVPGAKVRVRNLKTKISDLQSEFNELVYLEQKTKQVADVVSKRDAAIAARFEEDAQKRDAVQWTTW